ncbi:type II toxin-antitoxin system mRNA interferase toxin, RelE/StbE family [Candidatus Nomurabacteria bacterium]|nr:type II toxin-antitoxin system mRNA interferase toxin, RelE/StbE family [Candidatus Nomurabacteria bacterium]
MLIFRHKNFKKALQNQPKKVQSKFKEKMKIFVEDQFHYSLNNHALTGKHKGLRSINITGDIRVHYEEMKDGIVLIDIGSHSELY